MTINIHTKVSQLIEKSTIYLSSFGILHSVDESTVFDVTCVLYIHNKSDMIFSDSTGCDSATT